MDVVCIYPGVVEMRILRMVFLLSPLFSVMMPSDARAQMTDETRAFIVSEHNRLRRDAIGPGGPDVVSTVTATAMLEIEYDMALECVAQAYINTIPSSSQFTHNANREADYAACGGSGYVGESWYSGGPHDHMTGGATRAWVDFVWPTAWGGNDCSERQNYHGDGGCSGSTGHYTQVLWSSTYKVGCGYTPAAGTVCNYSPGGNYFGQPPFVIGAACSACPASHPFCNDGLCSSLPSGDTIFFNGFELLP